MSAVWLCIPSAAPVTKLNDRLTEWHRRDYFTAIFRDEVQEVIVDSDIVIFGEYKGYADAVNRLCRAVATKHPEAEWFVAGGDDISPDQGRHAHDIANECKGQFDGLLGVMQPTGDRWLEQPDGTCSPERACVSPWMGREWVERAYQGKGPLFDGYYHFYVDEELKLVSERLGTLWLRPDLTQYHDNWQRTEGRQRPNYLEAAAARNARDKHLFETRKSEGFPGHALKSPAKESLP